VLSWQPWGVTAKTHHAVVKPGWMLNSDALRCALINVASQQNATPVPGKNHVRVVTNSVAPCEQQSTG